MNKTITPMTDQERGASVQREKANARPYAMPRETQGTTKPVATKEN